MRWKTASASDFVGNKFPTGVVNFAIGEATKLITLPVIADGGATFGTLHLCGTGGQVTLRLADTYTALRGQLLEFIACARGGRPTYAFSETIELMSVLVAGIRSRNEGSRRVGIGEIVASLSP